MIASFASAVLFWNLGAVAQAQAAAPISPAAPGAGVSVSAGAHGRVESGFALRWRSRNPEGTLATVEVVGVDAEASRLLAQPAMPPERFRSFLVVRVVGAEAAKRATIPPLWGSYHREGDVIRFVPRFPLEPGMCYRAEFDPAGFRRALCALAPDDAGSRKGNPSPPRLLADFSPPPRSVQPAARVVAVYPSGATVPENLLRFYLHFSAPMSRGEAYRRVHLLDAAGKPVDSAFLELAQELWSDDGMRFTLLFQPGRIKRGLRPREEAGPILEAGKSYALKIDRDWLDARGQPLQSSFRKSFQAGAADYSSPDPKTWTLHTPRADTRDALEARTPEPLDRALLDRLVVVRDSAGRVVPGRVSITAEETLWRMVPREPWRPGEYRLEVGSDLEDLAGNSVARPFEVDVFRPVTRRVEAETVALPFRVGLGVR